MLHFTEQRRRSSVGLALGALLGSVAQVSAAPLLGAADDSLLLASPTNYQPPAQSTTVAYSDALSERDLTKATTDPDLYQWKREPSIKFHREAEAKLSLKRRSFSELSKRAQKAKKAKKASCLSKGSTQEDINNLFLSGGAGTKVALCPSVTYILSDAIVFTAANQVLYTQGYPTDSTRAILQVNGSDQSVAIWAACNDCAGVAIRNIEIDGSRPALGRLDSGAALIEAGGITSGQTVSKCYLHDPRGWSTLHIIEGTGNTCKGFSALGNTVGPSGESPNSAYQFHTQLLNFKEFLADPSARLGKRDDSVVAPGQWADGISLSCASSTVRGNTITDTTDGGIVIFGSPGSLIRGNTITSKNSVGLGGINLVDWNPWSGDYDQVEVSGNVLSTEGAMIKVGIAAGPLVWGSYNNSEYYNQGATIKNNHFISSSGYFGYGIAAAAHTSLTTSANRFNTARFNFAPSYACFSNDMPPTAGALVRDPYTTQGQFQKSTAEASLVFLICIMPCEYSDDGCTWGSTSTSTSKKNVVLASVDASAESSEILLDDKSESAKFVDDRPPFTYDSDKALDKNDSGALAHKEEPFQLTNSKVVALEARSDEAFLPGFGRNVYEKRDLVQGQFLAV